MNTKETQTNEGKGTQGKHKNEGNSITKET